MKRSIARIEKPFAFTLVETLLALALGSVLMVCVFGLIDSTLSYHVSGNDQALASQRMIGLLHDLRTDIRAVRPDPHWQAVPQIEDQVDPRLQAASKLLNSQLQVADMEKFAEPIRLVGQSNWLLLTLGHANPRWPGDMDSQQQIVWSLGGQGTLTVPTHDDQGRLVNYTLATPNDPGLMRSRIIDNGQQKRSTSSSFVIAAELLRFRYLADRQWRSQWNSAVEKRLPGAIEINLQMAGEAEQRTWVIELPSLHLPRGTSDEADLGTCWTDDSTRFHDANRAGGLIHTHVGRHDIRGTDAGRVPCHSDHGWPIASR